MIIQAVQTVERNKLEAVLAARAPGPHHRRAPAAAPAVVRCDGAPRDQEATRRTGGHAPADVNARHILPAS